MTPGRRRRAVCRLQECFGVSERRACRVAGQHRSTQRKPACPPRPADERLAGRLQDIAREHPRWVMGPDGPSEAPPRARPGGCAQRLRATHANHVWAVDFQFDETSDRRRIKLCNIVDEHTREALAIRVDRRCTAEDVICMIERLRAQRGAPDYLRADNGPEFIAWALRDYCRMTLMRTSYIEPLGLRPGSPALAAGLGLQVQRAELIEADHDRFAGLGSSVELDDPVALDLEVRVLGRVPSSGGIEVAGVASALTL